jgi:hypothetical protein
LATACWNTCAVPWKLVAIVAGRPISRAAASMRRHRLREGDARRQVERDGHRRQLGEMADGQRGRLLAQASPPRRAGRPPPTIERTDEPPQHVGGVGVSGVGLEDDLVGVLGRVDGRHLPRAEGRVERVADLVGGHAEARGRVAVDVDRGRAGPHLQVGIDVEDAGQLRIRCSTSGAYWRSVSSSAAVSVYWYCERLWTVPTLIDWIGTKKIWMPGTWAAMRRSREMTTWIESVRAGLSRRVMKRRPAFCVLAALPPPALAMTMATSGSRADRRGQRLGARHHGLEGGVVGADRRGGDEAVVLGGEEALGDVAEQDVSQGEGAERDAEHDHRHADDLAHRPAVAAGHGREEGLEPAQQEDRLVVMVDGLQDARAQHRRQGERDDAGDEDGRGDDHAELGEHASHHAAHEQHGDEHRHQRDGHGDDGEADLARADQRRLEGVHALLDVAHDVLEHDDGVVDDEAHRQRQRQQRDVVDRIAEHVHHREGADDGDRQGDGGDQRRAPALQEEPDDDDDEEAGQRQRELHILDRLADRLRAVVEHDVTA